MKRKILYLHGKEGSPHGFKAQALLKHFDITNPRLRNSYDISLFQKDLNMAQELVDTINFDAIVGSSRGGALACGLKTDIPRILIAPAWKKFEVTPTLNPYDVILHCIKDDIVDYNDSIIAVENFGGQLVNTGKDHQMSDASTLMEIVEWAKLINKRGNK